MYVARHCRLHPQCITSAHWAIFIQHNHCSTKGEKNMVGCKFGLISVGKRTLFKEAQQKVGYCQKTRRVCAFKAQLSSAGYFCKTLSSVKLTTTLICTLTLTIWLFQLAQLSGKILVIQGRGHRVLPAPWGLWRPPGTDFYGLVCRWLVPAPAFATSLRDSDFPLHVKSNAQQPVGMYNSNFYLSLTIPGRGLHIREYQILPLFLYHRYRHTFLISTFILAPS